MAKCHTGGMLLESMCLTCRDFDDKIFMKHPLERLQAEDFRLVDLTQNTKVKFEVGMYNYGK